MIYITEMWLGVFNKAVLWKKVWAESVVKASKQHIILYSKSWTHTSTALEYRLSGLELEKHLSLTKTAVSKRDLRMGQVQWISSDSSEELGCNAHFFMLYLQRFLS